jgi:hypothetical protein
MSAIAARITPFWVPSSCRLELQVRGHLVLEGDDRGRLRLLGVDELLGAVVRPGPCPRVDTTRACIRRVRGGRVLQRLGRP